MRPARGSLTSGIEGGMLTGQLAAAARGVGGARVAGRRGGRGVAGRVGAGGGGAERGVAAAVGGRGTHGIRSGSVATGCPESQVKEERAASRWYVSWAKNIGD